MSQRVCPLPPCSDLVLQIHSAVYGGELGGKCQLSSKYSESSRALFGGLLGVAALFTLTIMLEVTGPDLYHSRSFFLCFPKWENDKMLAIVVKRKQTRKGSFRAASEWLASGAALSATADPSGVGQSNVESVGP